MEKPVFRDFLPKNQQKREIPGLESVVSGLTARKVSKITVFTPFSDPESGVRRLFSVVPCISGDLARTLKWVRKSCILGSFSGQKVSFFGYFGKTGQKVASYRLNVARLAKKCQKMTLFRPFSDPAVYLALVQTSAGSQNVSKNHCFYSIF